MTTLGWSWLWMLLLAALALRMPRRKHDRWGPYRFVASRGALQPTQSAPVFRCQNPRFSAAVGMALLVLSTLATSAWGPHHPHHRAPPSPPPPLSPHPRCRVCAALTPFTAIAAHLSQPAPPHLP